MDPKRFVIGSVVGAIALFVVGYALFVLLFGDFFAANVGTATGVERQPPLYWAIAVGCLATAGLICLALSGRSLGLANGAKIGACVTFMLWVAADFTLYGAQNVSNLTATLVDPLVSAVNGAIAGALIGLVTGKVKPAT